jgi:hypothetical protein
MMALDVCRPRPNAVRLAEQQARNPATALPGWIPCPQTLAEINLRQNRHAAGVSNWVTWFEHLRVTNGRSFR